MTPTISGGIDHIHIYASDREAAAVWYEDTLGLTPDPLAIEWARDPSGPLVVQDLAGSLHLAIFKSGQLKPQSFAFGVNGEEYENWIEHLKQSGVEVVERDHDISWSIYFNDPYENELEITTSDHAYIGNRR